MMAFISKVRYYFVYRAHVGSTVQVLVYSVSDTVFFGIQPGERKSYQPGGGGGNE